MSGRLSRETPGEIHFGGKENGSGIAVLDSPDVLKSRLVVFGIDGWMHLSAVRQELGDYENACRNHQPVPPKGTETLEDKKTGADDRPIQGRRRITEQAQGKEVLVKKTKKGEVVSQ